MMNKNVLQVILNLLVILAGVNVSAETITLEEVKQYLSVAVETDENSAEDELADKPGLDILPLWRLLGIDAETDQKENQLFDCQPQALRCELDGAEINSFAHDDIDIIQITRQPHWDYQYYFFRQGQYIGHLDFELQKYGSPEIDFWDDGLFCVTALETSGSGVYLSTARVYAVGETLKELIRFLKREHRFGWGMMFDEMIESSRQYQNEMLTVTFDIALYRPENESLDESHEYLIEPVIKEQRQLVLKFTGEGFDVQQEMSNTSLEAMNSLSLGGYDEFYGFFKTQIDSLAQQNDEIGAWAKGFLENI